MSPLKSELVVSHFTPSREANLSPSPILFRGAGSSRGARALSWPRVSALRTLMALVRRTFQLVVERCTPRLERARCAKNPRRNADSRASKRPAPLRFVVHQHDENRVLTQRMHMNGSLRSGTTSLLYWRDILDAAFVTENAIDHHGSRLKNAVCRSGPWRARHAHTSLISKSRF